MFQQKKLQILHYNVHKFREKMMIMLLHKKKIKNYNIFVTILVFVYSSFSLRSVFA